MWRAHNVAKPHKDTHSTAIARGIDQSINATFTATTTNQQWQIHISAFPSNTTITITHNTKSVTLIFLRNTYKRLIERRTQIGRLQAITKHWLKNQWTQSHTHFFHTHTHSYLTLFRNNRHANTFFSLITHAILHTLHHINLQYTRVSHNSFAILHVPLAHFSHSLLMQYSTHYTTSICSKRVFLTIHSQYSMFH